MEILYYMACHHTYLKILFYHACSEKIALVAVHKRIIFKLLVLAYRSIRGTAPQYLSSLLRSHQLSRNLRSASQALLTVDRTRLDTYGNRAFSVVGPVLWNELPHDIMCAETLSSFKSQLKKHLFCQAFNVGL